VTEPAPGSASLGARVAANSLVLAAGSAAGAFISFFTFVAITRGLGVEAFGDLTAATVFLYIPVVLAELGFTSAVVREISRDPARTEAVMRASIPLRALVAAAAIGLAVGLGMVLPFNDRTKVAILISSSGAFLTLLTVSVVPVLQAQLKMHLSVGAHLAGRLATLGLTLGALALDLGFEAVVVAQVVGVALTFVLHAAIVARLVPLRPVVDQAYWRSLLGTSIVLGIAIAVAQVYFRIDALLIALIRSSEEVGLYAAAYKFIELSDLLLAAVGVSLLPPLARFVATHDARARPLVQRAFDVLVAAAAPLSVGMLAFAPEIVTLTAGDEFAGAADALRLLSPYVLFSFAAGVLWRVLLAGGRDRTLLRLALIILATNVALNAALLPVYGFEVAAIVAVATEALGLILVSFAARREELLPSVRYLPVVAAAAAAMGAAILLVPGPALVEAAAGSIAYLAVLLALPGTARELVFNDLAPALRRR
jgi:O-antigen/teichoic acid export membrane protein